MANPGARGITRPNRKGHPDAPWDAYIWVSELSSLHLELQAKGAKILRGPEDSSYDTREFEVEDCNGYVLCFGQDTSG